MEGLRLAAVLLLAVCLLLPPVRARNVCNLPKKPGNCYASLPRYYYDRNLGTCLSFAFGGCGGNGNNFETMEACLSKCVDKSVCQLEPERGPCRANWPRYFYNSTSGTCHSFIYGGCRGNGNRFRTEKACRMVCSTNRDECHLPSETGRCRGQFHRFFYDTVSGTCQHFNYGGCGGNGNRFHTAEACQAFCSANEDDCQLPVETGPCRGQHARYYYDTTNGMCQRFTYGGCRGNGNRFHTEEECQNVCYTNKEVCQHEPETGRCRGYFRKYFYNTTLGTCQQFIYGGCGGNANRFATEETCSNICYPNREVCQLPADQGPCRAKHTRYYYHALSGTCRTFTYGGCRGNDNRFVSEEACQAVCNPNKDRCQLPAEAGNCLAYIEKFFYSADTGQCESFIWGGCGGNENRFDTAEECQTACAAGSGRVLG